MTDNIDVFIQNSIRITTAGGKKIYIDPFRMSDNTLDADYIFLTHDHYDHFSPEDISKITKDDTVFVFPEAMDKKVQKTGFTGSDIKVRPGEKYETADFTFETVPAYNILKPFHPKHDGWVGYIFIIDGKRIYVAGDTDATNEAKEVKCDVALVPAGGTFTMDAKKAAELVNIIKPSVAIPVHYGEVVGNPDDGKKFASLVDDDIKVEVRI